MAKRLWDVANLKPTLIDHLKFCDLIGVIINAYNKHFLEDTDSHIHYFPAYPDSIRGETGDPVDYRYIITYDIWKREDGSIGTDPFSSKKERTLRMRGQVLQDDGTVRTVYGKRFDNMIRFDCFAPTTREANELIKVFEIIMEIHMGALKSLGVDQITYEGRLSPTVFERSKYRSRACLYYVREELRLYRDENAIKLIETDLKISEGEYEKHYIGEIPN